MSTADSSVSAPASRRLPWFPLIILGLMAVGIAVVRTRPELERNLQGWLTLAITLLAIILNLLWFVFTPRFSWRTRLIGVLAVAALFFGGRNLLRVDGTIDGTGIPNLVWGWTPAKGARWAGPDSSHPALTETPSTAASSPAPAGAVDFTQFHGSQRTGLITGPTFATDWKAAPPKQLWRQPVGLGWSSFAVVGSRIYTQEQRGEDELVSAYDLLTGSTLWMHLDKAHFTQWQGGEGPRATPTVLDGRVYAYGATGILNCLDAVTGKLIWTRSVLVENQLENIEWGMSASPLVFDDRVVVTAGKTPGPVLFAFSRETGEPLWKAGNDAASYASPMLATLAGRKVILSNNAATMTIHDPANGEVLLSHAWGIGKWPKASQPVVLPGDRIFLSAGYGMGCQLLQISAGTEGKFTASEIWRGNRMKTQFNSVAVRDGFIYGLDDGRLACLDLANGERRWKDGRFGSGQTLLVNDILLVQSESGPVYLAAAQPDGYRELAQLPALDSKTWGYPTLAGRYLLVRNDREAACYELPSAP